MKCECLCAAAVHSDSRSAIDSVDTVLQLRYFSPSADKFYMKGWTSWLSTHPHAHITVTVNQVLTSGSLLLHTPYTLTMESPATMLTAPLLCYIMLRSCRHACSLHDADNMLWPGGAPLPSALHTHERQQ